MPTVHCYVGIRHDVDTVLGCLAVPTLLRIEEELGIRSTFHVRAKLVKRYEWCRQWLKRAEEHGWEVGLHLDNTACLPSLPEPVCELEALLRAGFSVRGVSPHGGLVGDWGEVTWRALDSLGLDYISCYMAPPQSFKPRSCVLPPVIFSLEDVVRRGSRDPARAAAQSLAKLARALRAHVREYGLCACVIVVHPEYIIANPGLPAAKPPRMTSSPSEALSGAASRALWYASAALLTVARGGIARHYIEFVKLLKKVTRVRLVRLTDMAREGLCLPS